MKTYTLHLPPDAQAGDRGALDRAELVRDAFSWGAFFFTFLWFFYHRLWLAGLLVLAALVAAGFLFGFVDLGPGMSTLAQLLLQLLIGLEANSLRRWTLARHGRPAVDVVTAGDDDEAVLKAFARWSDGSIPRPAPRTSPVPLAGAAYRGPDPVIGLFPDPEARR